MPNSRIYNIKSITIGKQIKGIGILESTEQPQREILEQQTVDNLNRSIGDLDSNADKLNYLDYFSFVFNVPKKFSFEPHKGDEVSQVNAQSLIRYEMEKRFEQLDNRLKTLKAENNEIFKTIEATESSLLNFFDVKNCDMSDLFRDLNRALATRIFLNVN
jgi:SLIT-ROBO Rho GTPase activating protein